MRISKQFIDEDSKGVYYFAFCLAKQNNKKDKIRVCLEKKDVTIA
jgi:hypothetical protein